MGERFKELWMLCGCAFASQGAPVFVAQSMWLAEPAAVGGRYPWARREWQRTACGNRLRQAVLAISHQSGRRGHGQPQSLNHFPYPGKAGAFVFRRFVALELLGFDAEPAECREGALLSSSVMDELRDIQIHLEDDFVDIDLPLAGFTRNDDGVREISGKGLHGSSIVGFQVRLGPVWERQEVEDCEGSFYWGQAEFISLGAESDAFVGILADAYGTGLSDIGMCPSVPFLAVSLAGDPARLEFEPVRMKFFFDCDDEDRYAEFYLNVDICGGSVQFREKDQDFRPAVMKALTVGL